MESSAVRPEIQVLKSASDTVVGPEALSELERKVLAVLKRHGPLVYAGLYFLFDPNRTADIHPVLNGLREYGYIEVSKDNMATITASGLKRIEDQNTELSELDIANRRASRPVQPVR